MGPACRWLAEHAANEAMQASTPAQACRIRVGAPLPFRVDWVPTTTFARPAPCGSRNGPRAFGR